MDSYETDFSDDSTLANSSGGKVDQHLDRLDGKSRNRILFRLAQSRAMSTQCILDWWSPDSQEVESVKVLQLYEITKKQIH
ncbi:hypothetical protein Ciccas_008482 [Cichlidogyrus casuarinus]|uniref:Uncharacterized protein n=1 Tax=Cichlidogyrus casuarinus TaxID=1844966 RepID=A0ABD2Q143_9PLAT